MAYDNICKYLAERFPDSFSQWLLGQSIAFTELKPSELSTDPIRADSLIFLQSQDLILHLEFQTEPDEGMALRMLDYWVRLRRKYPLAQLRQIVLYLRKTQSVKVYQTRLEQPNTWHQFEVIRLWEQDSQSFTDLVGLLPLRVLSQTPDPEAMLREVAGVIETIPDPKARADLTAASAILAGLRLDVKAVKQILGSEFMKESTVYQEWVREAEIRGIQLGKQEGIKIGEQRGKQEGIQLGKQEGIQIGEQRGIQQGKHEEASRTVNRLLRRKLGSLSSDLEARIQSLTITQLEQLVEDLLDFGSLADLTEWLEKQ